MAILITDVKILKREIVRAFILLLYISSWQHDLTECHIYHIFERYPHIAIVNYLDLFHIKSTINNS